LRDIHVVILAAGKGTRMKSALPKVLHRVAGLPMIDHVLRAAATLKPRTTTVVVGFGVEAMRALLARHVGLTIVVQEPQLGTGHALLMAEPMLGKETGTLVLLSGDVPLLMPQTLRTLVDRQTASGAAASVITAVVDQPFGYGRIVRSGERIAKIV
jgi:bifunctional UDP-N-acetylglucosamine pyrophosphorylase/glucosamine-1-phosphate N-acetyltransferase